MDDTLLKYQSPKPLYTSQEESILKDPLQKSQMRQSQLAPLDGSKPNIEEILNSMFPPREFKNPEDSQMMTQNVSPIESSRLDLQQLKEELVQKLKDRQARKTGICPVREDLHNQLFDEIIRQCTINCPERGLLLLRVRDQIRMTLAAYQTLYQGSVVFGIRKQLQAEQGRPELEKQIEDLKKRKIYYENRKIELENNLESIQKSFQEIRELDDLKKLNELKFLNEQSKHLEQFLKTVKQSNAL